MKNIIILFASVLIIATTSCVSTKKYKRSEQLTSESQKNYSQLQDKYNLLQLELAKCRERDSSEKAMILSLENQANTYKASNSQMLSQLKDLSVITSTQAESINKSLENIGVKDAYIKNLQTAMNRKDSLNMALVINLKGAIGNLDDKDVNIKVDKGVVYVDISDKLLFNSGKYTVSEKAKEVLGKVAKVLQSQPDVEFLVEGHTDNVGYRDGVLLDNWDLSVKRATSVVRILQNQYHLNPARMTAGGRSEYVPVAGNDTKEGRAENRRTRIVILPQLDQFFKILEKPAN
jgi:chemotaxis protein MotB